LNSSITDPVFNEGFYTDHFTKGSLGASGDLLRWPIDMPALGFGEVDFQRFRVPAKVALQRLGLEPLRLKRRRDGPD